MGRNYKDNSKNTIKGNSKSCKNNADGRICCNEGEPCCKKTKGKSITDSKDDNMIDFIRETIEKVISTNKGDIEDVGDILNTDNTEFARVLNELNKYKLKEERGLLIHLPVPIGTPVYRINVNCDDCEEKGLDFCMGEYTNSKCTYPYKKYSIQKTYFTIYFLDEWENRVFFSRQEAEETMARFM